jgi:glycosyltransferase involved in cell wall biosynthesis
MTKLYVIYSGAVGFSGQTAAVEQIIKVLKTEMAVTPFRFPALERGSLFSYITFIIQLLIQWLKVLLISRRKNAIYCFAHGQSYFSYIRIGLLHLYIKKVNPSSKIITTLNGNEFLNWKVEQKMYQRFQKLLINSHFITATGPGVKLGVERMGIAPEKIVIINNPCEIPFIKDNSLKNKWYNKDNEPIKILHLSLLIESKGFPEYLEALQLLSKRLGRPVEAIICGPMVTTKFCSRFKGDEDKANWIEKMVGKINQSPRVKIKWIKGAKGYEKISLYQNAHLFVFPSSFPVESQPLVLIEAMANGCAIISSKVGEIRHFLNDENAVLLDNLSPINIATEMEGLISAPDQTRRLAVAAFESCKFKFSLDEYKKNWTQLITNFNNFKP